MKKSITLLYVDDEPINLTVFELNFKSKYNVITALSGDEGLIKLEGNGDIIVVISDMKMPGMNGIEFIHTAKHKFVNAAYFILTGFDITDEISEALDNDIIQKYFRKPFKVEEISEAIDKVVNLL